MMALQFTKSKVDSNLYFKVEGEILVMLLLYVDDVFLIGKEELFKYARRRLATEFKLKDLGIMHYFVGMEVWTREVCSKDPEEVQDDDRKAMTTPMASNLKLLSVSSSESVATMMYC